MALIFKICLALYIVLVDKLVQCSVVATDSNPMCTKNYSGGIGCHFERSICGGVITTLGSWVRTHATAGPIKTHVSHVDRTTSEEGNYIYLAPQESESNVAQIELFLSPKVTSICLSLHYATTGVGNNTLDLRVIAQYDKTNVLLEERKVNTGGEWKHLSLPLCLAGGQRSFMLLEVEGSFKEQIIAFDYIEITQSLRTCNEDTFNLKCSCSHDKPSDMKEQPSAESSKGSAPNPSQQDKEVVGFACTFKTGVCKGIQLAQNHNKGPRWMLGDDVIGPLKGISPEISVDHYIFATVGDSVANRLPAVLELDVPSDVVAAFRLRFRYVAVGENSGVKISVYSQQSFQKTLLATFSPEPGAHWTYLDLDCCMEIGDSLNKQILIESTGQIAPNNTVAIDYVEIAKGSAECLSVQDESKEKVSQSTSEAETSTRSISITPEVTPSKTITSTTEVTPSIIPSKTITPSGISTVTTEGLIVKQEVDEVKKEQNSSFDKLFIWGCLAAAVGTICIVIVVGAVVLVKRRNSSAKSREGSVHYDRKAQNIKESSLQEPLENGQNNPIYGMNDASLAMALKNPYFGGTSKA